MSNRTYDLVVLLDADAPTDTRTKIVNEATTLIGQHGDVKADKDWGTRQLPYLIDHHEQAAYHVFQFESAPEAIGKLDRGLKLTEGVLRFRIFETEAGQELPESPPLFKREERSYERPPREASATPTLDESPAPAAEAAVPAAEGDAAAPVEGAVEAGDGSTGDVAGETPEAVDAETAPADTAPAVAPADEPVVEPVAVDAPADQPAGEAETTEPVADVTDAGETVAGAPDGDA